MSRVTSKKKETIVVRLPQRLGMSVEGDKPETSSRFFPFFGDKSSSRRVVRVRARKTASPALAAEKPIGGRLERLLFFVVLAALVAAAAAYAYVKIETRQARFELTEMKQDQLFLIKERERLNRQIATYKRLDDIAHRAGAQGLVQPNNNQVITIP